MSEIGSSTGSAGGLTLYHSATSVCSAKVRLVLSELGVDWSSRLLDLAKGDQFRRDYLKLNPHGVVPTLVDNGQTVTESNDIMRHLCRRFDANSMFLQAAKCDSWLEQSLAFHVAINTLTQLIVNRDRLRALSEDELAARCARIPDAARAEKLRDIVENGFDSKYVGEVVMIVRSLVEQIDLVARRSNWLAGETFSLADAAMLPFIFRLELLGLTGLWLQKPSLQRWLTDAKRRPSFQDAIESHISPAAAAKFAVAAEKAAPDIAKLL